MDVFGRSGITPGQWLKGRRRPTRAFTVSPKRGTRGSKQQAFVTGDRELDAILRTFEPKEVRSAVRKATRATVKEVVAPQYRKRVEAAGLVETRAMRDIPKVRAVKRSRVQYGHELNVDHDKLIQTRRSRGGRIGHNKKRDIFRYLWAWEFGAHGLPGMEDMPQTPVAPMRRSLEESKDEALSFFKRHLRRALLAVAARAKLTGK